MIWKHVWKWRNLYMFHRNQRNLLNFALDCMKSHWADGSSRYFFTWICWCYVLENFLARLDQVGITVSLIFSFISYFQVFAILVVINSVTLFIPWNVEEEKNSYNALVFMTGVSAIANILFTVEVHFHFSFLFPQFINTIILSIFLFLILPLNPSIPGPFNL